MRRAPAGLMCVLMMCAAAVGRVHVPIFAQAPAASAPTNVQIYEKFRAWFNMLPPQGQPENPLDQYRKVLAADGISAAEIERHIRIINEQGQRLEIDRWNRILTTPAAAFNRKPNAFLVDVTRGLTPGTALDVGMGQGRNAVYLAQQGWAVTGFDPADKAVSLAREEASRLGVKIDAVVQGHDEFDFGNARWDLLVLSYVGARGLVPRIYDSLRPGGKVIVEAFHRDATKTSAIGGAVVFETNELLQLFQQFRVLRYEDTDAIGDFGLQQTRVVRLLAQKP
jgi:SAM-dependent methyltransferase